MTPEYRWAKGAARPLAEAAEALAVRTEQIMAVYEEERTMTVLYSPREDEHERVFGVLLRRDRAGILRRVGEPVEQVGLWDQITRGMDERLGGER